MKIKGTSELSKTVYDSAAVQKRASQRLQTTPRKALSDVYKASLDPTNQASNDMKKLRVKSNYARDKTIVLGANNELILRFDRHGYAVFPAHFLPVLETVMYYKPGRYRVVKEDAEAVEPATPEAKPKLQNLLATLKKEAEEEAEEDDAPEEEEDSFEDFSDDDENDETGEDE